MNKTTEQYEQGVLGGTTQYSPLTPHLCGILWIFSLGPRIYLEYIILHLFLCFVFGVFY